VLKKKEVFDFEKRLFF